MIYYLFILDVNFLKITAVPGIDMINRINPANKILITPSKEIKIKERKKYFLRRPCVQIYISKEIYLNTKKDLNINE